MTLTACAVMDTKGDGAGCVAGEQWIGIAAKSFVDSKAASRVMVLSLRVLAMVSSIVGVVVMRRAAAVAELDDKKFQPLDVGTECCCRIVEAVSLVI